MQRSIINKTIISWSHSTPRMLGSVAPALRDAPSARWARLLAWPQLSPPWHTDLAEQLLGRLGRSAGAPVAETLRRTVCATLAHP